MNKKILIIKPSALGDIIFALPILPELKKLYPQAKIQWLVFEHFAGILEGNKYLDGIITWRRKGAPILDSLRLIREIRQQKFDIVIDLQGLARTALISFLSGSKVRLGVPGLREFSYFFEKETGTFSPTQHAVERNLEIIKFLGAAPGKPEFFIETGKDDEKYAGELLRENKTGASKILIGFFCGAGIKQKMWPAENFASLANLLLENTDTTVVFFGSAKDAGCVNEVSAMIKNRERIVNAAGRTNLKQLCALIKKCRMVVGNDTGPLHLAAALNVIPVALFGPSSPEILSPYHPETVCFYKGLECSPCGISPLCKDNKCMKQISVEEVFKAVKKIIWKT